jgi:3-phosphoshikimate 1-carboxyvinyltransferase
MTASLSTPATSEPPPPRAIVAGRRPTGRLTVPPSKSLTHRYVDLALLSRRPVALVRPLLAEDTRLFLAALGACGWSVEELGGEIRLAPPSGAPGAGAGEGEVEISCGNCGTMLRFLVAALSVVPGRFLLDGVERLRQRPVGPLVTALRPLGARIDYAARPGFAPLRIAGASLRGGTTAVDASESSQYLSALLLAALAAPEAVTVEVEALSSAPYVDVTLQAAALFGGCIEEEVAAGGRVGGRRLYHVRPSAIGAPRVVVEGDASAACYFGAAAALCQGTVTIAGVPAESRQGDLRFFGLLSEMGAEVGWQGAELTVRGGGGGLRAVDADLGDLPDQAPTLAALAPFARGTTRIRNVAHLRLKESDRLQAMASELRRLGAEVEEGSDSLTIPGVWAVGEREPPSTAVVVDPHGDHRIAMSLAVTALRRPGVAVAAPGVVAKSYPGFWEDLEGLLGG